VPHALPSFANRTLPGWITPAVIAETRAVWQPFYAEELTEDDVLEILLNTGNLFRILHEGARGKAPAKDAAHRG